MTRGPPARLKVRYRPMAISDRETVHCSQSSGPTGKVGIGKVAVRDTPHANGILPHSTPDFKSTRVRAGNSHLNVTLGWIRKMGGAGRQFGEARLVLLTLRSFGGYPQISQISQVRIASASSAKSVDINDSKPASWDGSPGPSRGSKHRPSRRTGN